MIDAIQPGSVPFRKPEEERPNPAVKPLKLPHQKPENVPIPHKEPEKRPEPQRKPEKVSA